MRKENKKTGVLLAQPLYKRAEIEMTNRIATGKWEAGAQLPNEFALADEFGVSQGTIRKALMAMEHRGLLTRRPGRGTVVCKTTSEESLYSFFRLRDADGRMVVPSPVVEAVEFGEPTSEETRILGESCPKVVRLARVRENNGRPFVVERMSFDARDCDGIESDLPLPSSLYPYLHERFSLVIMKVDESITAALADPELAKSLQVEVGTPLLRIQRIARDLADRQVELRESYYRTDFASYQIQLTRSDGADA
ncbi:GntR family transcriptional regulator [Rhodovulum sulfidophilum]|uniref:GntR family transcriptional regulator n=1 Tax=Rhodovulum sulfidophilum TaxID=35806 RepID=UPI0009526AEE|nr:GntR family transcriptional regulator [Rhodovulum sulfidophilum]MBL3553062.1 GntR family transcriptional regulator [Rhodovulum sulfidophilum]OLS48419.1 hypothetical protein BV379_09110 [Rhodovulum sulfidophilum]